MSNEVQKARLKWRCHRGMLELDLLLMKFFDKHFDELNAKQRDEFEALLTQDDPELYAWLMGHQDVDKQEFRDIVSFIQQRV